MNGIARRLCLTALMGPEGSGMGVSPLKHCTSGLNTETCSAEGLCTGSMQQEVFSVPPQLQVAPTMRSISYRSHLSTISIKVYSEAHPFVAFNTRQHRPEYFVHAARTVETDDLMPRAVPTAGFRGVIMVSANILTRNSFLYTLIFQR